MKCARTACENVLDGPHTAIYNEPSTGRPRLYCLHCGIKIIRGNEHDTLKLKFVHKTEPPFQTFPCQAVGEPGHFTVARPGESPVFSEGQYHWPKDKAEQIADNLNRPRLD